MPMKREKIICPECDKPYLFNYIKKRLICTGCGKKLKIKRLMNIEIITWTKCDMNGKEIYNASNLKMKGDK